MPVTRRTARFRLLTLTINYDKDTYGPWAARRARIAALIRELTPDVVALQAVMKPAAAPDQATQLSRLAPGFTEKYFQPAIRSAVGRIEGSAFFSRTPLFQRDFVPLSRGPQAEDSFPRVVLHVAVQSRTGPLHLFNGHFSWVLDQTRQNFAEALAFMDRYGARRICAGDFNTPPKRFPTTSAS